MAKKKTRYAYSENFAKGWYWVLILHMFVWAGPNNHTPRKGAIQVNLMVQPCAECEAPKSNGLISFWQFQRTGKSGMATMSY